MKLLRGCAVCLLCFMVNCPIIHAADSGNFFTSYRHRFAKIHGDYLNLTTAAKSKVKGLRIKVDLYQLMQDALRKKQHLFQKRVLSFTEAYNRKKRKPFQNAEIAVIHQKIKKFDTVIDIIGQHIRLYAEREDFLVRRIDNLAKVVIPQSNIVKEKDEIVESLVELIKKEKNLVLAGASPTELLGYRQQIAFLFNSLQEANEYLGVDSSLFGDEKKAIYAAADNYTDDETLDKLEDRTNKYQYRFNRQRIVDALEVKRVEDRGSKSEKLRSDLGRIYDWRLSSDKKNVSIVTE